MSLINKMLQELDRRGSPVHGAIPATVVLPVRETNLKPRGILLGVGVIGVAVVAVLGWYFLPRSLYQPAIVPPLAMRPITPQVVAPERVLIPTPEVVIAEAVPVPPATPKRLVKPVRARLEIADAPLSPRRKLNPAPESAVSAVAPHVTPGADLSLQQRAENAYRRALGALQEGRVTEAMTGLQQALDNDPQHEAARQTLIRLLLENNRPDDATRQLQQALALNPAQPAMAMMLARMQIDKGGPALDTLTRTMPYALGNGEYQAFFAGVLQRQQRFKEAGEHYELALRTAPQNGVWWMGLGISLQAQQRLPEAKEAFTRAKNSAGLTPELQAFVDRKLQQLTR